MCKNLLLSTLVLLSITTGAVAQKWVDLFNGRNLDGWSVRSGYAKYHVEDGALVGTAVKGSPNTFLCTNKQYGDFILEFEVKVDSELNSGVQIRSHVAEKEMVFWFRGNDGKPRKRVHPAGRVYGYQVEISDRQGGNSGGIYDEARRGFFLGDALSEPASKAFKSNQWNKYRVQCKGGSIKTWVNSVPCADFIDSLTARGIIGLQVHGLGKKDFHPYQVRWRNIRIMELD